MKKNIKYLPIFIVWFLIFPLLANAICFVHPDTSDLGENSSKLIGLLEIIISILQAIGVAISTIMVIVGGIQYMTAGGNETKAESARKLLTAAVIGFAIVIAGSFILCLVEEIISTSLY